MVISKLDSGWTLSGYYTYAPFVNHALENGAMPRSITGKIPASVPGSVTFELVKAGLLQDPYYELQSYSQEWVGNRWWVYENDQIMVGGEHRGKTLRLIFKGIDYHAHIYLNGHKLGEHIGMFYPAEYEITDYVLFDQPNTLRVCLEHTPFEHSYTGYISEKSTVKTHCAYKWDFCCRMVDMGLYDDVLLCADGGICFGYKSADWDGETLHAGAEINSETGGEAVITAQLSYLNEKVAKASAAVSLAKGINEVKLNIPVPDPKLWYPNGYGAQPLYDLRLTVGRGASVSDAAEMKIGLRTLEYLHTDGAPKEAYPYLVKINGRRIWLKGANICPTDLMTGLSTDERYEHMIKLAHDGNFNAFRVWGGGNFERENFYSLCDKYGIVVMHDFLQSNVTNVAYPNHDPDFLNLFEKAMTHVVKTLRSHPCLVMFDGGNEIRDPETGGTIGMDDLNISMLKRLVDNYAPGILMLPTCGSGPSPVIQFDKLDDKNIYHDVHGPWQYMGIREHYRMWNCQTSMLNSEFGCNGMANPSALKRIIGEEHLHTRDGNTWKNPIYWHHHDGWDTYLRDSALFGQLDLNDYIKASQYIMAEGLRYGYESCRKRAFVNCGAFAWQLNEPWPNSACTNIIDYYGTPKLAYFLIRDALLPVHISMEYDALAYGSDDEFSGRLFVHNDGAQPLPYKIKIKIAKNQNYILEHNYSGTAAAEGASPAGEIRFKVGGGTHFIVCCALEWAGGEDTNRYLFFIRNSETEFFDLDAVKRYIKFYPEAEINNI